MDAVAEQAPRASRSRLWATADPPGGTHILTVVSGVPPLGSLAAFSGFTGPRQWGPDGSWRVTFGSGDLVIKDLLQGLRAHKSVVDAHWPRKASPYPVVLGAVPWLTDQAVADSLASMTGCVVVDKRSAHYSRAVERLASTGKGVWQPLLGLEDWGPRQSDGTPQLIGPGSEMPGDRDLEPVRVLGYAADQGPLMHIKLAVCCGSWWQEGEFGEETHHLTPLSVWMGSANWTQKAALHIEFGAWTTDERLCQVALDFMTAVIKASEPRGSPAPGPLPEMTAADWDDDAFWEYDDSSR